MDALQRVLVEVETGGAEWQVEVGQNRAGLHPLGQGPGQIVGERRGANAAPGDIERGMAAGFFDYVTKPIKVARFMQSVNAALAHAASQKAQ